jgi:hypothetical protein
LKQKLKNLTKEKMAKLLKEISVITGKYTNAQGQEKNRYTRVGSIIETKNGEMLKIDVMPLMDGGWNGWAYINEPREKDGGLPKDDDINF